MFLFIFLFHFLLLKSQLFLIDGDTRRQFAPEVVQPSVDKQSPVYDRTMYEKKKKNRKKQIAQSCLSRIKLQFYF